MKTMFGRSTATAGSAMAQKMRGSSAFMEKLLLLVDRVPHKGEPLAVGRPTVDVDRPLPAEKGSDVGLFAPVGPHASQDHFLIGGMLHRAGREAEIDDPLPVR